MDQPLEKNVEKLVSRVLRIGIVVSGILMLAGFFLSFFNTVPTDLYELEAHSDFLVTYSSIPLSILLVHPLSYLYLGILALMLTPIVRVCITAILFLALKDLWYVIISVAVLGVIIISIALSFSH